MQFKLSEDGKTITFTENGRELTFPANPREPLYQLYLTFLGKIPGSEAEARVLKQVAESPEIRALRKEVSRVKAQLAKALQRPRVVVLHPFWPLQVAAAWFKKLTTRRR